MHLRASKLLETSIPVRETVFVLSIVQKGNIVCDKTIGALRPSLLLIQRQQKCI